MTPKDSEGVEVVLQVRRDGSIGVDRDAYRNTSVRGARALQLAVLEDGIRAYLTGTKGAAMEAELWLHSNSNTLFAFGCICQCLDLDPSAVRKTLMALKAQSLTPGTTRRLPRSRPNIRPSAELAPTRKRPPKGGT